MSKSVSESVISQSEREREEDDDIINIKLSWRSNSLEKKCMANKQKKKNTNH